MSNTLPCPWPELPTAAWRETYATLHLWTQIVGKIRLAGAPWLHHSWSGARPRAEPLVACRAVRHHARPHDLADPRRHAHISDRLRFHQSSFANFHLRRRQAAVGPGRTLGSELLHGRDDRARRTRHPHRDRRHAE